MSESFLDVVKGVPESTQRPVLVPVDFSSCSRAALLWAARFVGFSGVPLVILHVIHESGRQTGFYRRHDTATKVLKPIETIAEDMLSEFVDEVFAEAGAAPDIEVRTVLVTGLPATRIVEVAVQQEAGLIVMGTHGRSGLSRLAAGSVAAEVMTRSGVPVTVVKEGRNVETFSAESPAWWKKLHLVSTRPGSDLPQEPIAS
jgi:nucleotide-binding universal stress UspA family protein